MILTCVFQHLKIDLSDEKIVAPSIDIDHLLKRVQAGLRAHPPPHPASPFIQPFASSSSSSAADPYAGIMTQLKDLSLNITSSTEKILASQEALQKEHQNDMSYVYSSIRYLQRCCDNSFFCHNWPVPIPDAYVQPLPLTEPPFDPWAAPQDPSEAYRPVVEPIIDIDEEEDV